MQTQNFAVLLFLTIVFFAMQADLQLDFFAFL